MMNIRRRQLVVNILGGLGVLFLLVGCGSGGMSPAAETVEEPAASATESSAPAAESAVVDLTNIIESTPDAGRDRATPAATPVPEAMSTAVEDTPSNPHDSVGDADVTFVRAVNNGETWTFHVTVRHEDTGWEDYADGWDVVLPDGTILKADAADSFTRLLLHPHENEQPFTRSQSGLMIPAEVDTVTVRAHDLIDGWGGQTVTVDLSTAEGDNYTVE